MRQADYVCLLRKHDWHFEFSDDARVYAAGRDERKQLRELQPRLDPDARWWNEFAPAGYRIARVDCEAKQPSRYYV